jgi:hypothetical protein
MLVMITNLKLSMDMHYEFQILNDYSLYQQQLLMMMMMVVIMMM